MIPDLETIGNRSVHL